jgi:hypothetical protein
MSNINAQNIIVTNLTVTNINGKPASTYSGCNYDPCGQTDDCYDCPDENNDNDCDDGCYDCPKCPCVPPLGPQGETGPTGLGATGPTGLGETGPTGLGETGPTGLGATGPTGLGETGPTGLGETGPTGLGETGPTGLGETGPTGLGETGPTGLGETGPTGLGETGPTGLGETGPTGLGETGPTGLGETGPTGLGETGPTGPTGLGETGPQGEKGFSTGAIYYFNNDLLTFGNTGLTGYTGGYGSTGGTFPYSGNPRELSRNISINGPFPGTATTVVVPISGLGSPKLLQSFLTPISDPNIISLPAGNWNYEIYASVTNGTPKCSIFTKIYTYNDGSLSLLKSQSADIPLLTTTPTLYLFSSPVLLDNAIAPNDRIYIEIWGTLETGTRLITLYFNDSTIGQVTTSLNPFVQGATGPTGGSPWIPMNYQGVTGPGYTGTGYTGDVMIFGNLYVSGGIDPTYLALEPQATTPFVGAATGLQGIWIDSTLGDALRVNSNQIQLNSNDIFPQRLILNPSQVNLRLNDFGTSIDQQVSLASNLIQQSEISSIASTLTHIVPATGIDLTYSNIIANLTKSSVLGYSTIALTETIVTPFSEIKAEIGVNGITHTAVGSDFNISSNQNLTINADNIDLSSTGRLIVPTLSAGDYMEYNTGKLTIVNDSVGGSANPLLVLQNTNNTVGAVTFETYKNDFPTSTGGDAIASWSATCNTIIGSVPTKTEIARINQIAYGVGPVNNDGGISLACKVNSAITNFLICNGGSGSGEIQIFKPITNPTGNIELNATSSSGTGDITASAKGKILLTAVSGSTTAPVNSLELSSGNTITLTNGNEANGLPENKIIMTSNTTGINNQIAMSVNDDGSSVYSRFYFGLQGSQFSICEAGGAGDGVNVWDIPANNTGNITMYRSLDFTFGSVSSGKVGVLEKSIINSTTSGTLDITGNRFNTTIVTPNALLNVGIATPMVVGQWWGICNKSTSNPVDIYLNGVFQITLNNSNALLGSTIRVAAASTTALYII